MAIENWHLGKIVILWAWGVVLTILGVKILLFVANPILGFAIIGAVFALPLALSIVTWRCFGGKEPKVEPPQKSG